MKLGYQKVFQTNFSYTKARAHNQAPLNGAFTKSIAHTVIGAQQAEEEQDEMGSFSSLSTQCADNSIVSQGYQ